MAIMLTPNIEQESKKHLEGCFLDMLLDLSLTCDLT